MTKPQPRIEEKASALAEAINIMARLRAPDGCPWDREQTFDSIKRHTLEETYEVFDAIERRAWPDLQEELGDLLLQVLFYAQMAEEAGYFSIEDVARSLRAKLVRRHPHIFAGAAASTSAEVSRTWEAIKASEKVGRVAPTRYLDDVPTYLPAVLEAFKLGQRAAKIGFDWPDVNGLFEKLEEESAELKTEVNRKPDASKDAIEDELGDLLFTAVNLARHLELEPEFALSKANRKFRKRFNQVELLAGGIDSIHAADSSHLDQLWRKAKSMEHSNPNDPEPASPAEHE